VAEIGRNGLIFAVALLGAANATLRPVTSSIHELGWLESAGHAFGVNPAVWVALILALVGLHARDHVPLTGRDLALAGTALLGLTIPSATISWLVVAAYALALAFDTRLDPTQRTAALILAVAALRAPLISEPLLAFDAALAASALALFMEGVYAEGNLVLGPDGARLVILTSCSSLANLSYALLFWFAVSRTLMPAVIACALVSQNVARLALMATSDAGYEIIHGPSGRLFFELLMLFMVTGITLLGVRDALAKHPRDRAAVAARSA
jgi:hypothetical protein